MSGKPTEVGGVEAVLFDYFGISTNADNFLAYYPSPYMGTATEGNCESQWFSNMLQNGEFSRLIGTDLLFASFSILFVLFWLRVHTKSTFISLVGMYMIFFSIPFSLFFYKIIYGIPFFTELHSLVLFIVLGVGADDIFVLVDSWKDTAVLYPGEVHAGDGSVNFPLIHRRLHTCYDVSIHYLFFMKRFVRYLIHIIMYL